MHDEQIRDFVSNNELAHQVWLNGYEAGHLAGQERMALTNEQAAELAARRFLALDAYEVEHRRFTKEAVEAVALNAYRTAPGSAYVPRSLGDAA